MTERTSWPSYCGWSGPAGMVGPCQKCGTTITAEKIVLSWRLGRWWQLCDACSEVVTTMDELHGLSEDV